MRRAVRVILELGAVLLIIAGLVFLLFWLLDLLPRRRSIAYVRIVFGPIEGEQRGRRGMEQIRVGFQKSVTAIFVDTDGADIDPADARLQGAMYAWSTKFPEIGTVEPADQNPSNAKGIAVAPGQPSSVTAITVVATLSDGRSFTASDSFEVIPVAPPKEITGVRIAFGAEAPQ